MSRVFISTCIAAALTLIITGIDSYDPNDIDIKSFTFKECKAWRNFQRTYNKTYTTMREMKQRKKIFVSNLRRINAHNKKYENGIETFNCTVNQFSDMTRDEFGKEFTGLSLPDQNSELHFGMRSVGMKRVIVTNKRIIQSGINVEAIDWRRTAVTSVKRQGNCGSCWLWSAAGALEGQIFIKLGRRLNVSVQYYLDCIRTEISAGCDGGLMTDAYKYAMLNGVVNDEFHPYVGVESPEGCLNQLPKIPIKVMGYVELLKVSEIELQQAVATTGPISIAIDARWQSLQFYDFGVYFEPLCNASELNHAVLVVGYGTDPTYDAFWIVKNSWGKDWGESGYVRIARNKSNHCGIASMPSYPVVKVGVW